MADIHVLTAQIGPGGMSMALTCPYAGATFTDVDPPGRPLCRRADPDRCAAAAGAWIGPAETIGAIALDVVDVDGGLYLRSVEPGPPDHHDTARALARLSGHARYAGDDWRRLFEQVANVEHAAREALRRGGDKAVIGPLRDVLRTWHEQHVPGDMPKVGP